MAAEFLTVAGVLLRVPRGQAEEQPDGWGKRRWLVTPHRMTRADEAALRAAIGPSGGAESDRAPWDGTLHTGRPLVQATGEAFGAVEGQSGTVTVEVTITGATYRHTVVGGEAVTQRVPVLVLREA